MAQRLHVLGAEQALLTQRGAEDDEDALDQLWLETGLTGNLTKRRLLLLFGEEILGKAEGKAALAPGALEVLERVAALAHARDDAGLGGGCRRPAAAAYRQDLLLSPAFQRAGRDAGAARCLAERYSFVGGHRPRGYALRRLGSGRCPRDCAPLPRSLLTRSWLATQAERCCSPRSCSRNRR